MKDEERQSIIAAEKEIAEGKHVQSWVHWDPHTSFYRREQLDIWQEELRLQRLALEYVWESL
jgi:hypothetical protein